jgi:hypothetical protein
MPVSIFFAPRVGKKVAEYNCFALPTQGDGKQGTLVFCLLFSLTQALNTPDFAKCAQLRDVEDTNHPEIAPGLGSGLTDSIEQNRSNSSTISRILRLRIG